jgi:hypothetical protein
MSQEPMTLAKAIHVVKVGCELWAEESDTDTPNEYLEAAALLERAKPWILAAERAGRIGPDAMDTFARVARAEFWLTFRAATGDRG